MKDILYIVMPAYNEEANIEDVIMSWYPLLNGKGKDSRLIVADSGSIDTTHSILLKLQEKYSQLEIISNTGKQHGPKVIALYDYSIQKGANYIFQTDSDGQTNPLEFASFWEIRAEYDAVIGKRITRGDGKARAFVEHVVCFLLHLYFGVRVPDANAPFRLMKAETVKKYLYKLPEDYNLPNIMMTTYFSYFKERIKFVDISFRPRQGGVNSINIPRIIKIGWKALYDFSMLKRGMRG